ncbi:Zn-ribbon domain-containing OB-fold protein [Mycolicibacterium pulveris]|uniref:Zn-ribbon domain-containing OB-fold protein n=1 Tax=Mycolicibacterium pulveris TaxID=36813 RepID=UPI003CE735D2
MSDDSRRPLPVVDDPETGGFWKATTEHRLVVRVCNACAAKLHLPKSYCHNCGSWDVRWRDVRPTGSVYSWTVLHHTVHEAFPAPWTVVLVQLDEDPSIRFIGQLPGAAQLAVGMPMRVRFEDVEPGVTLPQWEPVPASELRAEQPIESEERHGNA